MGYSILVILRRDHGESIRLITMALKVLGSDLPEDAGKAAFDIAFLLDVGGLQEIGPHLCARQAGHLFDPHHQDKAPLLRGDRLHALMDRGGPRRTGIFHARSRLETPCLFALQHEGGWKTLGRKALPEGPEYDLINVFG